MYISGRPESDVLAELIESQKLFRYQGKEALTYCQRFESQFASHLGSSKTLLVTSGTNALILALEALELEPGDEVLVPSFTFFATIAAITKVQAVPIIVNIDETLTIDIDEAQSAITNRTRAIIAVHMDGLPCHMTKLKELATKNELSLIEDVAQAVGGSFQGQSLGTFGRFGCFSFNVDKIISCGEGGAISMNDSRDLPRILNLHDTCSPFGSTHQDLFKPQDITIGHSMRVSELSGAMMLEQLKKLDLIIQNLRETKTRASQILTELKIPMNKIHCSDGDCGTSIYIKAKTPSELLEVAKMITSEEIHTLPIHHRAAHAFWQWIHVLKNSRFAKPHLNPFSYSERNPQQIYHSIHFTPTLEILTTSLKIRTPYFDKESDRKRWLEVFKSKASLLSSLY
jgi:dTDP-4-amino-4,6-dideoxygalactose transaminase